MADFSSIDIPPQYPALIAAHARNVQNSPAPAAPDFDANLAAAKAHAQHQDSLRMWRVLAVRGHQGAADVVAHHGLAPLPALASSAPTQAPVKATVPRTPRVTTPALPQASPVSDGAIGRVQLLTALVNPPPVPKRLLD